jgi:glutathione peroxidase
MRLPLSLVVLTACGSAGPTRATSPDPAAAAPHEGGTVDHTVTSLDGNAVDLARYRGKTLLIVNTASECGFTPQYAGLQELHERYQDRGLVVLGFPSNDFGGQEPGEADEIATFCRKNYGVSFPMFAKVHARGPEIAPLYRTLTEESPESMRGEVRWNFTKFLVDPAGKVVGRFEPGVKPLAPELVSAVEQHLP